MVLADYGDHYMSLHDAYMILKNIKVKYSNQLDYKEVEALDIAIDCINTERLERIIDDGRDS